METNQTLDTDFSTGLYISSASRNFLKEASGWAKFLSIIGFILVGLMVIAGISMMSIMSMMGELAGDEAAFSPYGNSFGLIAGGFYFLIALLYFFPVMYLFRFSSRIQMALRHDNQEWLDSSFEYLKSHYKFLGIGVIALFAIYVIAAIVMAFGVASVL
ncbi:MAG: hypothetical protein AAFV95_02770 [Bacteroidota bacterium]